MRKEILLISLLTNHLAHASLTDFTYARKKEKPKPPVQKTIQKTKKIKDKKISDAIIWHLPDRNFLAKKLSLEEQRLVDSEALNRFIEAASQQKPEVYKIYHSKNKNSQLLDQYTRLIANHTDFNILNNYIETKNQNQEHQKQIVLSELKHINKLYTKLKDFYSQKKNPNKIEYEELKLEISRCCGLENFLYVESLLKREINFAIFSS